jgi:hypothetical protein
MTYPDRENTLSMLAEWQGQHAAVNNLMDGIDAGIGIDPSGLLFTKVWILFDRYSKTLSVEIGDFDGWLDWYSQENDMGAKGMTAGYDGRKKPIETLEHLLELIEQSRARE